MPLCENMLTAEAKVALASQLAVASVELNSESKLMLRAVNQHRHPSLANARCGDTAEKGPFDSAASVGGHWRAEYPPFRSHNGISRHQLRREARPSPAQFDTVS